MVLALNATMAAWSAAAGHMTHDGYLFLHDPIVFELLHTESKGCKRHLCGIYRALLHVAQGHGWAA